MKAIILSVLMFVCCLGLLGQQPNPKQKFTGKDKPTAKVAETPKPAPAQPIDEAYTKSIVTNTTLDGSFAGMTYIYKNGKFRNIQEQ